MADYLALALPGVRALTPYQGGKPVEELQRELGLDEIIKLASNENPLGAGTLASAAATAACAELGRYPDGNGYRLKQVLASHLGVTSEHITLGNGSNEILELIARAFVGPEHEVLFAAHSFAVYALVTQAIGARAVVTPLVDWQLDLQAMRAAVTERTRLIFVANPNNPTGSWVAGDPLRTFIESLPDNIIVVIDEAYFEYVEHPDYPDTLAWLTDFPNLLITRTFSKIHGLAALRIGYGLSSPTLAGLLNRVRQPFNINHIALCAAEAAVADQLHVEASIKANRDGLAQIEHACGQFGLDWIPSVGNFLCIDFGRPAEPIYQALLQAGVIVRPVANYGLPTHLRVSIGTEAENCRFIEALGQVLA